MNAVSMDFHWEWGHFSPHIFRGYRKITGQVKKKKRPLALKRLDNPSSEDMVSFIEDGRLAGT